MYKVKLPPTEQLELNNLKKKYQGDAKIFRRLRCVELRSEGVLPRQVFDKLDVSADSITDWVKIFLSWWFEALCDIDYDGRRESNYKPYEKEIRKLIEDNCYNSYKELRADIEEKFHVGNCEASLYKFCKFFWIRPTKSAI